MNRLLALCLVICGGCTPVEPVDPESYAVTYPGGTIGTILSGASCDRMLFLADTDGRIHRVDIGSGQRLSAWDTGDLQPMAVAGDCANRKLWVVSPAKPVGLRAVAFDLESGGRVNDYAIPAQCFPTSATVAGAELFIAGECVAEAGTSFPRDAASYYENRRIGVRMHTGTGAMTSGLEPYALGCDAAGGCVGGSIAVMDDAIFAGLPASSRIGVYGRNGEHRTTLNIASPLFKRDGRTLPLNATADERMQWWRTNSLIYRVYAVRGNVVLVHHVVEIPDDWTPASTVRPQFKAWASVFRRDGKPFQLDLPLPELPVAVEGDALIVVDYGADGRRGAHESITVRRLRLPLQRDN